VGFAWLGFDNHGSDTLIQDSSLLVLPPDGKIRDVELGELIPRIEALHVIGTEEG
jgi:hypothetical protein